MTDEQFTELMLAMREQTDAINRMADTQAALVQAMAEAEGLDDEEQEPATYLDGSPVSR
ncbi:hypothetical protein [Marinobacter sp. NSM]|uniref:hypothetical protein n=1 Tax=Marinobacter sp. NSM TaxID=3458004 RepID=UPI004036B26C